MALPPPGIDIKWPELDEWSTQNPIIVGMDFGSTEDRTTMWIVDRRNPDDVQWREITQYEAAMLHDTSGKRFSGDVEQMIADIDCVEITPKTRCDIFQRMVDRNTAEMIEGILTLQHYGKF